NAKPRRTAASVSPGLSITPVVISPIWTGPTRRTISNFSWFNRLSLMDQPQRVPVRAGRHLFGSDLSRQLAVLHQLEDDGIHQRLERCVDDVVGDADRPP